MLSFKDKLYLSLAVYTNAEVVINDRSTNDPGVFVDEAKDFVDGVGQIALWEYLGALVAIVGKGIDVINLNLAISLVLPKNCSAQSWFID